MAVQTYTPASTEAHDLAPRVPTVLIVDDDDAIRALAQWVAQRAGYETLTSRDGPEALECFKVNHPRIGLVLLDLTMPRMTGAEVVAGLRNFRTQVPIVLITGYGADSVRDEEKVGVAGVLQKPFTPDDLRRLLENYLGKAAVPGPAGLAPRAEC